MKKSFVTALVVGSCMLATDTASAQEAPDTTTSLLAAGPQARNLLGANRRHLDDEAEGANAKAKKNKDTSNDGGEEDTQNSDEPQEKEEEE